MHIVDLVYYWARTIPLHPAVIEPEGVITYASLAHAIELSAEHFGRNILDRSKPVAVSIPTASKMLVAILGLLRARFDVVVASRAELKHLRLRKRRHADLRARWGKAGRRRQHRL